MEKQELVRKQIIADLRDWERLERAAKQIEKGSVSQLIRQAVRQMIARNPKRFEPAE